MGTILSQFALLAWPLATGVVSENPPNVETINGRARLLPSQRQAKGRARLLPSQRQAHAKNQWAQWRGPLATGVAPHAHPPIHWSDKKNIRWKTKLPGQGLSAPIVWGDRIFLTAAIPVGKKLKPRYSGRPGAHDNLPITQRHEFAVLAIDRRSGKIVWRRTVHKGLPHEGGHISGSLASASAVTDGKLVFAFFGSRGLYCLDMDGKLLWQKHFGQMHTKHGHGEGSSPALHGDTLIVNWDHEEQSFLIALDKRTGRQRWKVARDEITSWATPIVVVHKGKAQIIVPGTKRIRGYDLATGKVIWQCGGMSANIVASPVAAAGIVIMGSSYEKRAMLAIRLDGAKGDITGTKHVLWTRRRGTPYVPSPLLYKNSVYFLRHYQPILSHLNVKTGQDRGGPYRLPALGNIYASPVAAAGRVYITDMEGATLVISHAGKDPKVLAVNRLDEGVSASAALVGRELFLRGRQHLYCIAEKIE